MRKLETGGGLLARAVRGCVNRLPAPARRTGARLLNVAPLPESLRQRLRRVVRSQGAQAPPPGVDGTLGYPAGPENPEYAAWAALNALTPQAVAAATERLAAFHRRPLISVLLPVHDPDPRVLKRALRSVGVQIYPDWELCIVDDACTDPEVMAALERFVTHRPGRVRLRRLEASGHIAGATNAALALARGEYVAFLDHDDDLTADALLEMAAAMQEDPAPDILYSDHDVLGMDGRRRTPSFKPDWCPELLLSYMYLGHLKVYRTELVRKVGGLREGFEGSADYDLALRMAEATDRIRHVPRILYHWRAAPGSMGQDPGNKPESFEAGRRAVQEALNRRGIAGTARQPEFAQRARNGIYKIDFRDTRRVPVTIVIPTRDRLPLLRACIDSIEAKTTHQAWELVIVDNESREDATLDYLSRSRHRVRRFENDGRFNFSAIVNAAVAEVRTELFVLLNNDTVVISPEWLDEMVGYGSLPGVGAVGAKLLYPDGRIQHAGVILGTHGLTGHAFQPRRDRDDELEYGAFAHVARNYLAVSAACMLSRKDAFAAVGGFNERELAVGWNDVDYCLRLREHGYRVVFNPYALLYHLESQSRGDDKDPREIRYMMGRWGRYVERDPFYSPHLSCRDAEFRIKSDPAERRFFYYREYQDMPPSPPASTTPPPITYSARAIFEQCAPWTTRFDIAGERLGGIYNFTQDERIQRLAEEVPLAGRRVLELGCLEGGHSVALSRHEPKEIVAVEGRAANYVRCCVVKNLFGLDRVRFALDDVRQVTPERYGQFDVLVTMGVLYHLPDPHVLVANLARLGDIVYLTTAYANALHPQHSPEAKLETPWGAFRGRRYSEYGLEDPLSGLNDYSIWLYCDDLLEMCRRAGFANIKVIAQDDNTSPDKPPSTITLLLRK